MQYGRSTTLVVTMLATLAIALSPVGGEAAHYLAELPGDVSVLGTPFASMFPGAVVAGGLSPTTDLNVGVTLQGADPAGLATFTQAVSTPGDPLYHHYLTPGEFAQRYSPSTGSYASAEQYFQGYGLKVVPTPNRLLLGVSGGPSAMGAAFHTSFADYALVNGAIYYGPTTQPSTPASLGLVAASGFTDALKVVPAGFSHLPGAPSSVSCPTSMVTGSGPLTTFTPSEVQSAYGVGPLVASGDTGTGETIGIVDAYDSGEPQSQLGPDLSSFSTDCNLAAPTVNYDYPMSWATTYNSTASNGWGGEEVLDMEWAHAIAPGAALAMSFSPSPDNVYMDIAVDWLVEEDNVNAISLSWGSPDIYNSPSGSYAIGHPIFEAATAEGISVFSSTGDCGVAEGTTSSTTLYPSSDPDVTGVAATNLTLSGGGYGSESGWGGNESGACSNNGGSGGGWGPTPQPWYQRGPGVVNKGLRGVPDVSMVGGSGSPLDVVQGGRFGAAWGTSAASPQWAALAVLADQMHGSDLGLFNPTIYSILRSTSYSSYFHDITTGNNGYSAGIGWDPVTGVGTPIASALVPVLANGAYLPPQNGISATLTGHSGGASTEDFTATASGGSGGYLYSFNYGDGNGTTSSASTASWSYPNKGAYFANVIVYDSSGNASVSPFVSVSMGTPAMTASVSVSGTALAVGQSVTFTAAASGGTAPYFYDYFFGDGSSEGIVWGGGEDMGYASTAHVYASPGTFHAQILALDSARPYDGAVSSPVTITVAPASPVGPQITTFSASPNPISLGASTNVSVATTGGTMPLTYAYTGLPSGCPTSNASALRCTPSATGTFLIKVIVTDSTAHAVSRETSLTVSGANSLVIGSVSATPNPVTAGKPTVISVSASGGTAPLTYTYSSLPSGCQTQNTATLSCTPNASGTFTVEITVTDAGGNSVAAPYSLIVDPAPGGGAANNTPFYETLPFLLIVGILLFVIVVAAVAASRSGRSAKGQPPSPPMQPYPPSPSPGWPVPPSPPSYASNAPPTPPGPPPPYYSQGAPQALQPVAPAPPARVTPPSGPRVSPGSPCRGCGSPVGDAQHFCDHCGAPIASTAPAAPGASPPAHVVAGFCPHCASVSEPDARFCMTCGEPLSQG